jgi:hypothetical protein
MASITFEQMTDLVKATLPELGRKKFTDLTSDLREFVALKHIYNERENTTGRALQWNALGSIDQTRARMVGLYQVDNYGASNVLIQASTPWRHHNWNWSIDVKEIAAQADPLDVIVELEFLRKKESAIAFAFLMENQFWGALPATTDALSMYGVRYWIVASSSQGFNGTLPGSYTSVAGIDPTATANPAYARWANYTDQFVNLTMDDFVMRLNRATLKTRWVPPVEMPQYGNPTAEKYGYYTNDNVYLKLKRLSAERGDAANEDLAFAYEPNSDVTYNRVRVYAVPALNGDTGTDTVGVANDATYCPFIGIDWSNFQYMVLKGRWNVETGARRSPLQHETMVNDVDGSGAFRCTNRRTQMWLQSSAAIGAI